jgi:hypothetical protein
MTDMGALRYSKVALCTPCYDGRAHIGHNRSIGAFLGTLKRLDCEGRYFDAQHGANLPRLRNTLVAEALSWGAETILWVDSDVAFTPHDALPLLRAREACVGAAIQRRPIAENEPPSVTFRLMENGGVNYRSDGLVEVGLIGTAFAKTDRIVFEKMGEAGIALRLENEGCSAAALPFLRSYFWYDPEDTGRVCAKTGEKLYRDPGEDYTFFRRASALGFKSFIHPTIRPVHHEGRMRLEKNFWDLHGAQIEAQLKPHAAE